MSAETVRLPAVASVSLRRLLDGPPLDAHLLGNAGHAAWYRVEDEVLVLSDRRAVRLPNAIEVDLDGLEVVGDGPATIGAGVLRVGNLEISVNRWWDPRPAMTSIGRLDLQSLGCPEVNQELLAVLADRSPRGLVAAAGNLVGLGPGLTPDGDDVLAGALSTTVLLGPAVGESVEWIDSVSAELVEMAYHRTTLFSAVLIRCALAGQVAEPVGKVFRALTGRGQMQSAVAKLREVGHSSGRSLLEGITCGATALTMERVK